MPKAPKPRNRAAQDINLINLRAMKKNLFEQHLAVLALELELGALKRRVAALEKRKR